MNLYYITQMLQVFHCVAYKARNKKQIVAGLDEFLDQVTVLPPGEWDRSVRIEPPATLPSQVSTCYVFAVISNASSRTRGSSPWPTTG